MSEFFSSWTMKAYSLDGLPLSVKSHHRPVSTIHNSVFKEQLCDVPRLSFII